jgi:hypothetical protein
MSVESNGFALTILSDNNIRKYTEDGYYYYALPHMSEYKLRLTNNRNARCDAIVSIDGEKVGTWRVNSNSSISISRPAKVDRKFTLAKENSYQANSAGIFSGSYSNGLIKVEFKPEKNNFEYLEDVAVADCNECVHKKSYSLQNMSNNSFGNNQMNESLKCRGLGVRQGAESMSASASLSFDGSYSGAKSVTTGATILGESSGQKFRNVTPIYDVDFDNFTTINARLVVENEKKYVSIHNAIHHRNNIPAPPRVDDRVKPFDAFGSFFNYMG